MSFVDDFFINSWGDKAEKEGWNLFEVEEGLSLQRCDESMIFKDDIQVWIHVFRESLKGSRLHFLALRCIEETNIEEYNEILKVTKIIKISKDF